MEEDRKRLSFSSAVMAQYSTPSTVVSGCALLNFWCFVSFVLAMTIDRGSCAELLPPLPQLPPEGLTEDPLASLLPHYIKKSNVDPYMTRNVTTQVGQTVYLHCIVNLVGDRTVSWIRLRDFHLLTVGKYTYTSDTRFQSVFMHMTSDWALQIKYPQVSDEGLYECQISSFPSKSVYLRLWVVVPQAKIVEGADLYIEVGSPLNLTCIIVDSPEAPAFVFWYHEERMINYDSSRGTITVQKGGGNTAISKLKIKDALPSDSGNYTCCPSNADSVSIIVYVVKGEQKAVIQNMEGSATQSSFQQCCMNLFLLLSGSLLAFCNMKR